MLKIATSTLLTAAAAVAIAKDDSGSWEVTKEVDPMTDQVAFGTHSDLATPIKKSEPPFADTKARIQFGCMRESNEAAWIKLSHPIVLEGDQRNTHNGGRSYQTRVRWDQEPGTTTNTTIVDFPSTDSLYLPAEAITKIKKHKTLLFEIKPFQRPAIIFKFDLTGAVKAINEAQALARET